MESSSSSSAAACLTRLWRKRGRGELPGGGEYIFMHYDSNFKGMVTVRGSFDANAPWLGCFALRRVGEEARPQFGRQIPISK